MNSQEIIEKLDRIEDLPTLPAIAMDVNEMPWDYNTSIKELSQTIQKDQAMVPRILKLVNSAFFGFRSKISVSDSDSEPDLSAIYTDAASIMGPQLETVSDWFPEVSEEIHSGCEFFLEER